MQYRQLHNWITKQRGKPDTCEHCGLSGLSGHAIHWANKSHKYKQDLSDWLRLCKDCHYNYDKLNIYASGRTHCKNGHEFNEINTRTRIEKDNGLLTRVCRKCQRVYRTRSRLKLKQLASNV